jgi:hypothetical protein
MYAFRFQALEFRTMDWRKNTTIGMGFFSYYGR